MHPDWVRSLRDQCQAAGVPFFLKSWGEWCNYEQMPDETYRHLDAVGHPDPHDSRDGLWRVGKRAAGHLLDGVEWRQMPEAPHVVG
jgi:protein gp37